jgi:hypothetical protein
MARHFFGRFYQRAGASDYEVCLTITGKRAAAARLHNELRPIHFINRGASLPRLFSLQAWPIITKL